MGWVWRELLEVWSQNVSSWRVGHKSYTAAFSPDDGGVCVGVSLNFPFFVWTHETSLRLGPTNDWLWVGERTEPNNMTQKHDSITCPLFWPHFCERKWSHPSVFMSEVFTIRAIYFFEISVGWFYLESFELVIGFFHHHFQTHRSFHSRESKWKWKMPNKTWKTIYKREWLEFVLGVFVRYSEVLLFRPQIIWRSSWLRSLDYKRDMLKLVSKLFLIKQHSEEIIFTATAKQNKTLTGEIIKALLILPLWTNLCLGNLQSVWL